MDKLETTMFRVRQQYQLIVEWFRLYGGTLKNGSPKHPEVPAGLPSPDSATIAQIRLIAGLLRDGVLKKYAGEQAANGKELGQLAEEILEILSVSSNGAG